MSKADFLKMVQECDATMLPVDPDAGTKKLHGHVLPAPVLRGQTFW